MGKGGRGCYYVFRMKDALPSSGAGWLYSRVMPEVFHLGTEVIA